MCVWQVRIPLLERWDNRAYCHTLDDIATREKANDQKCQFLIIEAATYYVLELMKVMLERMCLQHTNTQHTHHAASDRHAE